MTEKRNNMVEHQIEARGVSNKMVLDALRNVERHLFIPKIHQDEAYGDFPLPIGLGQTISQPYIVALMTELLDPQKEDRVLEIGTGSGYQAAVLSKLVNRVYTMEIIPELGTAAEKILLRNDYNNVIVRIGDGYHGWPEEAPFDKIIVTAAPPEIPEALINQLKIGGKMVIPVGTWLQELMLIEKNKEGVIQKSVLAVRFVPMVKGKKK